MAWLNASQALAILCVRPQTLYANVSRGRIRAKPDPLDSRRRLYHGDDIRRLATRHRGRRNAAAVAAESIAWGDPVLNSSLCAVADGRHWYRGHDALALARTSSLEQVAALLWQTDHVSFQETKRHTGTRRSNATPLPDALRALAEHIGADTPDLARTRQTSTEEAASLVGILARALLGPAPHEAIALHQHMSAAWHRDDAQEVLRRSLVLLADHELNTSTLAARVAASTGAPLAAALLAGLATLTGPLHGGASLRVRALVQAARRDGAVRAVRAWLERGHALAAFGHRFYADGDPRTGVLLECFELPPAFLELRAAVETLTGARPNVDFALAAIADVYGLPPLAPFIVFAIARSVGWLAHAIEQSEQGELIRPRARYVGPALMRTNVARS